MIVVVAIMMGIDYFTAPKDKYGNWKDGQKIHYYKNNDDKYFLRTDSNQTSSDNLGELPTF